MGQMVAYWNRRERQEKLTSRPQELPQHELTEPNVTLSHHPALVTKPLRGRGSTSLQKAVDSAGNFVLQPQASSTVSAQRLMLLTQPETKPSVKITKQLIPHLRRIKAAMILPPAPQNRIEHSGNIIQRQMPMMVQSPSSNAVSHRF